jgi:hypothetical protein
MSEFERSDVAFDIMDGIPDPASDPMLASAGKPQLREIEETEESFRDKELSYYGIADVESLDDVVRTQRIRDAAECTVLRVMHCTTLTSMKGIAAFVHLRELNLSSNSLLSMSALFEMGSLRLEVLNLSCNKLTQLHSLSPFWSTLRKLVLSHNRLTSLTPLSIPLPGQPVLEHIDLNDNFIGDLDSVRCL